ncbi:MAG: TadE/TadG family type IV pilus assembly protein [Hyphomicrobiaceae bacterium]
MTSRSIKFAVRSLGHTMRRLARSRDGIAAVEFAYIAPVLLIMLMGTFEISRAVSIDRRINTVSAMASELVAREDTIDNSGLEKIVQAMKHVMKPYDDNSVVVRIVAVRASNSNANDTRVEWSFEHSANGSSTPVSQCASYTLDQGLTSKGTGVIVAEVGYTYEPVFNNFIYRGLDFTETNAAQGDNSGINRNWTSKAFHAPRKSCVDYNGTNCVLNCQ